MVILGTIIWLYFLGGEDIVFTGDVKIEDVDVNISNKGRWKLKIVIKNIGDESIETNKIKLKLRGNAVLKEYECIVGSLPNVYTDLINKNDKLSFSVYVDATNEIYISSFDDMEIMTYIYYPNTSISDSKIVNVSEHYKLK